MKRFIGLLTAAALAASCGGGGSSPAAPAAPLDVSIGGASAIKARTAGMAITVLEERPISLTTPGPGRRLAFLDADGSTAAQYVAPAGSVLVDFAQHPSGEVTAVTATARALRLVRLDRMANVLGTFDLVDNGEVAADPFFDSGGLRDPTSLLPVLTRDAARVAPIGEDVALALHTGINAVVAYRFSYAPSRGYGRMWRTLVEPGISLLQISITSGTFDTFDQLVNHLHVHIDADSAGNVVVAATSKPFSAPLFAAHARYFNEAEATGTGVVVTRLDASGARLGSTVIETHGVDEGGELHALRMDGSEIALVGRVFTEKRADGTGWDAYAARIDRTTGALVSYRVLDVDKGDILFDIAPAGQGVFIVGGATGYVENPGGASVLEPAAPLLGVLDAAGTLTRVTVAPAPRINEVRTLVQRGDRWLAGGMVNGPGTHSADANPGLLTADGFLREVRIDGP